MKRKTKPFAPVLNFESSRPWPERGSADLIPDHQKYLADRGIKKSYCKLANYRSEPDGIVIPYPTIDGAFDGIKFLPNFGRKRLVPSKGDQKFTQPAKQSPRLYFAPLTQLDWRTIANDPSIELYVIEGELHAAAAAQYGIPAIGIGGVWNWAHRNVNGESVLIDDFAQIRWRDRSVVVVFDHDVIENRSVQLAAVRFITALGAIL